MWIGHNCRSEPEQMEDSTDMIPFPTDSYMRALAEAIYAVAYLEGLIRYDLYWLEPPPKCLDVGDISWDTMGKFAKKVRCVSENEGDPEKRVWLQACVSALEEIRPLRDQVVHSTPATMQGAQVLNRWTATKDKRNQESFPITEEFLTDFRDLVCKHIERINHVRLAELDAPHDSRSVKPSPVAE